MAGRVQYERLDFVRIQWSCPNRPTEFFSSLDPSETRSSSTLLCIDGWEKAEAKEREDVERNSVAKFVFLGISGGVGGWLILGGVPARGVRNFSEGTLAIEITYQVDRFSLICQKILNSSQYALLPRLDDQLGASAYVFLFQLA